MEALEYTSNMVDKPLRVCSILPTTARRGEIFFLIGTINKIYACFAANVLTEVFNSSSSANFADNETPTGTVNGVNDTFTLAHAPSPSSSLLLYVNGLLQQPGGADYTLTTATIVFATASIPNTGAIVRAYYRY